MFRELINEGSPKQDLAVPSLAWCFDCQTGKARVESALPECPPVVRLPSALREAQPSLGQDLRQRHGQMRRLGRRLIGKSRRRSKRRFPYLWGRDSAAAESSPPQPGAGGPWSPVALRNDPCPRGSGRKFKQCCGAV
ncbi:MAG: SEC-C metal-binding domain-containing protein [Verrucomicrobia bacterium]|nr:SEC-C metal-binding domain-containing protein [Verrucomicrobiota bacterium]